MSTILTPPPQPARAALSAIIASCDERDGLGRALESLAFCDERLVLDLECSDDSAALADRHGARVIALERPSLVEIALARAAPLAAHDWLLLLDPDEWIDPALARELVAITPGLSASEDALVFAPMRNYFRGRALRGGVWGGERPHLLLVNRARVTLEPHVHRGVVAAPATRTRTIERRGENVIHHDWMHGYANLLARHRRYLRHEGAARAAAGESAGAAAVALRPARAFWDALVARRGYRDGARGVFLAGFWAWYDTTATWALWRRAR